jgi:flagellar biosynthesis protein
VKVAVALGHSSESKHAPKVLAGGRGAVAEQILNIAFAQGVRVREDADLAQLLAAVDIDSEIPVQAFAAVAEILVYVWRANGAAAGSGPFGPNAAPPDQPLPDQPFMERAKGPAG